MGEKHCKYLVRRDKEDGRVLPKGLALIKLQLYETSVAKDPESGRRIALDHLSREKLISIRININNVCHGRCAILEAIRPILMGMGVPERLQADILEKIASSRHLRNWTTMTHVPPIKVIVRVRTDVKDYKPEAEADAGGKREWQQLPFDPLHGAETWKIEETRKGATRCVLEGVKRREELFYDALRFGSLQFFLLARDLMMNCLHR